MILENKDRIIIKAKARQTSPVESDESSSKAIFHDICDAIREGGYNPISQIVGYLISEDPAHITNYKNARTLIGKLDRDELLEEMVATYINAVDKEFDQANNK